MKNKSVSYIVKVGLLSAIALILYLLEFPIFPAFPWLMADASDVPALLGGFALGPIAGVLVEFIKNVLHFAVKGMTGGVGELANFLLGVAYVLPAIWLYRTRKSRKVAIIGMLIGVVLACVMSIVLNLYVFIPLYFPSMENVWGYIFAGAVPMTAIKTVAQSIIVALVYKPLSGILHK